MIIIGLDPGLARTGFGILDTSRRRLFVRCGCLTTPSHQNLADRLNLLAHDLTTLIKDAKPDTATVEEIFFGTNTKTAMLTAQARGVLLHILRQHRIVVSAATPLQIKAQLTGQGQADKHQMQMLVKERLNLDTVPQPDDAADALAAALYLYDTKLIQHTETTDAQPITKLRT